MACGWFGQPLLPERRSTLLLLGEVGGDTVSRSELQGRAPKAGSWVAGAARASTKVGEAALGLQGRAGLGAGQQSTGFIDELGYAGDSQSLSIPGSDSALTSLM